MTSRPELQRDVEDAKSATFDAWGEYIGAQVDEIERFLTLQARLTVVEQDSVSAQTDLAELKKSVEAAILQCVDGAKKYLKELSREAVLAGWEPDRDKSWRYVFEPFAATFVSAGYEPFSGAGIMLTLRSKPVEEWKYYRENPYHSTSREVENVPVPPAWKGYMATMPALSSTLRKLDAWESQERRNRIADAWGS
ncbi:hypothetical protein FHX48_000688 [Microbacterium halimionae]|uniref:Uncharacterized protein n=1 Tax=Microbacterium halimionae TaxID=1526413 RepID=A0A7W3PL52_9MICO|nr:hypothetical protein [Microbacterium halimionae]MBA8815636.1 hypothetical protein [Microbacterium halimionae]NII95683.1 hypothetical protein [Microbacterium halimionae]